MQAIEVTARFDSEGRAMPTHFTWGGRSQRVIGVGRRWEEEDGEHILVMAPPDNQVYELLYQAEGGRWFMVRTPGQRTVA